MSFFHVARNTELDYLEVHLPDSSGSVLVLAPFETDEPPSDLKWPDSIRGEYVGEMLADDVRQIVEFVGPKDGPRCAWLYLGIVNTRREGGLISWEGDPQRSCTRCQALSSSRALDGTPPDDSVFRPGDNWL